MLESDNFCPTCGTSLEWEVEGQHDQGGQQVEPQPAQKSSNWGAWVIGILAAIGGLWVFNSLTDDGGGGTGSVIPSVAQQERYSVFVDQPPSFLTPEQAGRAERAVNEAILGWSRGGTPITRVYSEQDANMYVQFIKEWGGDTLGQQFGDKGGLLQVGLGNSDCMGEYVPFAEASIYWIAAHEMGHALGLPHSTDPNDLMYHEFNPTYADYCKMWDSSTSWSAGTTKGLQFTIDVGSSVKYQVQDRDAGSLDVCIMTQADWNAFTGSNMRGYACHDDMNRVTDAVDLAAGSYVLAMRCENYFDNCVVDYSLWRWP